MAAQAASIASAAAAVSHHAGGYALMRDGSRRDMPPGKCVLEQRNEAGRCTRADYVYSDGSRLKFKWSESRGSRWNARHD
jgi:hypothetical protein